MKRSRPFFRVILIRTRSKNSLARAQFQGFPASGKYLQFLNHRSLLIPGGLKFLIDFICTHEDDKPVMYFSNGALEWNNEKSFDSFDGFVNGLRRYASWTSGVGIWKEKYDRLPRDLCYDQISPHSSILFSERHSKSYIINDCAFFKDIENDHSKKGKYDLFKAFGVEEFSITLKLYLDGDISTKTLKNVKKDYGRFLSELYFEFIIRKKPCSYKLDGFDDAMGIFFSKGQVIRGVIQVAMKKVKRKILKN